MDLTFASPWGLLGLLGIPAVLAVHFLQRRAVVLPASTLFLLERLSRESQGGRRVERLRPSLPLWLQLLAVLILTWLMADPRWLEKSSVQRLAVVLDSSASMTVAKESVLRTLPEDLARLGAAAAQSEVHVLDSRLPGAPLYHGPVDGAGISALRKTLETAWQPAGGAHEAAPALRLARSLAGPDGLVLYVTDAETANLPPAVRLYASGRPVENAGVAGVSVDEESGEWRATLRNYGRNPQNRVWQVLAADGKTVLVSESLTLPPGGVLQRGGPFPPGMEELTLTLSPDAFTMDDRAPVLRPKLKEVAVSLPDVPAGTGADDGGDGGPAGAGLIGQVIRSLPGVVFTGNPAQAAVQVRAYDPLAPAMPEGPAVVFVRDARPAASVMAGPPLVEPHRLTDGLGWQGLICQESPGLPPREGDEVLVWMGDRAVVFLRSTADGRHQQLCFNFDLNRSNARRLPALVLTIHRWMEEFRRALPGVEHTLTECGQLLDVAPLRSGEPAGAASTGAGTPRQPTAASVPGTSPAGAGAAAGEPLIVRVENVPGETEVPVREASLLRAPLVPAVMEVRQGRSLLLRTASHFADVREADFTGKGTRHDLGGAAAAVSLSNSRPDPAWRFWVLTLLGTAAVSWWWQSRRRSSAAPASGRQGLPMNL